MSNPIHTYALICSLASSVKVSVKTSVCSVCCVCVRQQLAELVSRSCPESFAEALAWARDDFAVGVFHITRPAVFTGMFKCPAVLG